MTDTESLDPSIAAATRDQQTVTPAGELIAKGIHGVKTVQPVVHSDHRGRVFEVFPGANEYWS